jgi:class 3 adenylate cyclase
MGSIDLKYKPFKFEIEGKKYRHNSLTVDEFKKFNSTILDIGDISQEGTPIKVLVAIFDLEGFTDFFNQLDPDIVVPEYLSNFLSWIFEQISNRFKKEEKEGNIIIFGSLPFYAKFLGDGILFIWDIKYNFGPISIGNIIHRLYNICKSYITDFLPKTAKDFSKRPPRLRCGIVRGQVIPIGNGKDYVGPCINLASRLQKMSQLTFSFSRRGINIQTCMPSYQELYVIKKVKIRGIGEDELIYVPKDEFDSLPPDEKKLFKEP